jgi:hypothetical protein
MQNRDSYEELKHTRWAGSVTPACAKGTKLEHRPRFA